MEILSTFASLVLWTTKEAFIISVLVVGVLVINRDIFTRLLFITLTTMILAPLLKSIWQIPLPEHLGIKGYAFPSGHMQLAFVFWSWLAWEYKKVWSSLLATFFIPLVGWALIHQGYHHITDIMGALGFGTLTLVLFALILRTQTFQSPTRLGFLFIGLGALMIALTPGHLPHVWVAVGALVGFVLGELLYDTIKLDKKTTTGHNALRLLVGFVGIAIIYAAFTPLTIPLAIKNFSQFSLIAFWVGGGIDALFQCKCKRGN